MKMSQQQVEQLLRKSRPADEERFTTSPAGRAVLGNILASERRRAGQRRRRFTGIIVVAAISALAAAGVGSAVVATYSAPEVPTDWRPPATGAFLCATAGLGTQFEVPTRAGESPIDACRRGWRHAVGEAAPAHLFACAAEPLSARTHPTGGQLQTRDAASDSGQLLYVVDGDEFGDAGRTCGSVHMLVVPDRLSDIPQENSDK